MGILLSRWRTKKSTAEVLDSIAEEIGGIEEFSRDTQAWHKKLIGYLLAYFSILYLVSACVAYFRYLGHKDYQDFVSQLKLMMPFIVAPVLLFLFKRILTWWYHRKVHKNDEKLQKLKEKRTKILNEVMETETYKVAKEILEKYAPEQLIRSSSGNSKGRTPPRATPKPGSTPSASEGAAAIARSGVGGGGPMELRRRLNASTIANASPNPTNALQMQQPSPALRSTPTGRPIPQAPLGRTATPPWRNVASSAVASATTASDSEAGNPAANAPLTRRPPGPPLPRPVLPRERGFMDRAVEYLVGDGPHNRYALICKQCQSHNGMALREEFEYVAYRCAYCFYWNPARKQRPVAPRLQPMHLPASSQEEHSSSSDEEPPARKQLPIPPPSTMTASSSDAERSPKKTTPTEARTGDKQRDSKDENEGGESEETEETKVEDEQEKEEAACH